MSDVHVARLYRHPVKSFGCETLERAMLVAGESMPDDRRWAITHGRSAWDDAAPGWISCHNFLRVANAPALAAVMLAYDAESTRIEARHPAVAPLSTDLATEAGRAALAEWAGTLAGPVPGPYKLVEIPGGAFTDSEDMTPSIMSLASLRDLGARMGTDLDPRRFRGNIWIESAEPWAELDWAGREIRVGGAVLRVTEAIPRCRATMANPETGERDVDPLAALERNFGHTLFGVEAKVIAGGPISLNDRAELAI